MNKPLLLAAFVAGSFGAAAQCNPPSNLGISNVTSTSATLSFVAPAPAPVNYIIEYKTPNGAGQTVNPSPTASPVLLSNLTPGTAYTVTITSYCPSGFSSAASTGFVTGTPSTCPAVSNLVATATATAVAVTATAAPGASGYFIDCATAAGALVGSTASATPQYTFTGLPSNVAYRVCVTSICSGGGSPPSACATAQTVLAARAATESAVSLAPNPASRQAVLTLAAEWSRPGGELLISNSQHVVRRLPLPAAPRIELDLTGLAAGLYAVQVRTSQGVVVKRLVVE